MLASRTSPAADAAGELFDRYTLPKVALVVILTASFVGTWLTTTLSGHGALAFATAKWAYFVALGILMGGLVWKHAFVRPADLGADAADYCAEMYDRFDRIATGATIALAIGGAAVFTEYLATFGPSVIVSGFGLLLLASIVLVAVTTVRNGDVDEQFRSGVGLASLVLVASLVVLTAVAEVSMRGMGTVAAVVRILHLLAFSVWVGGAVWNIFVAVPTGQKRPTTGVVRAAGEQLERFRWAVRFVIPTLLLTGLYQSVDVLGTNVEWYLRSTVGLAILAKVGFIGALVVIFKLCPMWRACSPIEGVCELEDVTDSDPEGNGSGNGDPAGRSSEVSIDD